MRGGVGRITVCSNRFPSARSATAVRTVGRTIRFPGEQSMRNRILGIIGVLWGGGIVVSFFVRGANTDGAYGAGQMGGVLFGVVMFLAGTYYAIKGGGGE